MNETTPKSVSKQTSDEISLLDLLQTAAENSRLLILGPLAVGVTVLSISFTIAPTYTATTQFLPPQQQQSAIAGMLAGLGGLGGLASAAAGLKNPGDQYVAYLKSNSVEDALIERFKLQERYEAKFKQDTRDELGKNARISSGKDGLITIEVDDKDAATAADLANGYVEELGKLLDRLAVTEAQQRRQFFEKQLQLTQDKLKKAEQALGSSGVNASALKSNPEAAVTAMAQLQAQVTAQEVKVASLRSYLTESAPDFRQAMTELGALRAQLNKIEAAGSGQKDSSSDYVARYRDYKYHETLFELFAKQYELAKIDEAREGAVIQVIDTAQPPEKKSKPKEALIAVMATLASGFSLLLFVFAKKSIRDASNSKESAEKLKKIKSSFLRALGRSN